MMFFITSARTRLRRWRFGRFSTLAAAMLLALAAAFPAVQPVSATAGVLDVTCTPPSSNTATFSPPLTLTPQTVTVSNSYQYGPCVSLSQPSLTSGTRASVNVQKRNCLDLLAAGTITFTINWNIGQSSTVSGNTTTTTSGAVIIFTTTGTVTSGLFAGSTIVQVNTAPATDILLCTAGLGTVSSVSSVVTLEITSA